MERVQFIDHKGKQILRLDFTNAKPDEVVSIANNAISFIAKQPPKSLRTLTDVTNMAFDAKATEALKQLASRNKPYVNAAAVVGITGLKLIIYNAVVKFSGRNLIAFNSDGEAKEWLSTQ